jgi:transposase
MPLKKGLLEALEAASRAHPDKTIRLDFQDEARVGQKGRLCHRWWPKGQRATGSCDRRFASTYIFGAPAPETGDAFGLILPRANTSTMSIFLEAFAETVPDDVHGVMVLDQAGWHGARKLAVANNITLIALPPYSPELNPVERVWPRLRERFSSLQPFADDNAIVDACCHPCNTFADNVKQVQSLCLHPWIKSVIPK